ncbi:MAG TPA: hypothetical protein VHG11_00945 [Pseudorhizobium sp.]|nr:hypothetical protein [Pseudorhizobium sp.]
MSDLRFSFPACVIAGKGEIMPNDVRLMRQLMWPEGITSRLQATMAIALDECCPRRCPEWTNFLVEAITGFVVGVDSTNRVVTGETAGWLLEQLAQGAEVRTDTGVEIILHVLETAERVPDFLSATMLNQLRLALLPEPRGPYARRRSAGAAITKQDLGYVWRILRSALDRGQLQLSRTERLVLAAIDGLGNPAEHHVGWREIVRLSRTALPAGQLCSGASRRQFSLNNAAGGEAA